MRIVFVTVVVVVVVVCGVAAGDVDDNDVHSSAREPRTGGIIKSMLPYFNLKIKNPFECRPGTRINGYPVLGTCMSQYDCTALRGRIDGTCASGYGSCCILEAGCGDTVERNRTYIINNGTTSGTCTYTIAPMKIDYKVKNSVSEAVGACQVRLDFETFSLSQPDQGTTTPNNASVCNIDSFEVTGNTNAFGKICGENQGQHIYLPIDSKAGTVATITVVMSGATTTAVNRSWRIRTTYIPCLSNMTAPPGCLQYFTDASGTVNSFNLLPASSTTLSQIGNLKYSICFNNQPNSCGMSFSSTRFLLTGAPNGAATTGPASSCAEDYIATTVVDRTGVASTTSGSFFCGGALTPFTTYAQPTVIFVRTDGQETSPTDKNYGFALSYSRAGC